MTHLARVHRAEPARTECALAKGVRAARRDPRAIARAPRGTLVAAAPLMRTRAATKKKKTPAQVPGTLTTTTDRHVHEAGGAAGGAIAGAALGFAAGPVGAAAGALIGGAIGAFVAKIGDEESERVSLHDGELDAAIGVNGGDLGAPNLEHPPATRGTYSAAAAGGSSSPGGTAAGPMQTPED